VIMMKGVSPIILVIIVVALVVLFVIFAILLSKPKAPVENSTYVPVQNCPSYCTQDSNCSACVPTKGGTIVCRNAICSELIVQCNSINQTCYTPDYETGTYDENCQCVVTAENTT